VVTGGCVAAGRGALAALIRKDAIVEELRLLCGDEAALIEQRTALVNQLQRHYTEYYPAGLGSL